VFFVIFMYMNKKVILFDFDGVIVSSFDFSFEFSKHNNPELTENSFKEMFEGNFYEHDSHLKVSKEQLDKEHVALENRRKTVLSVVFGIFSVFALLNIPKLISVTDRDAFYYGDLFNLAVSVVMLYIIYQLYKNRPFLKWFMYLVIVGAVGSSVFWSMEKGWLMVAAELALAFYVIYYITTPLTKKVQKIANFVLLPLSVLLAIAGGLSMTQNIDAVKLSTDLKNPNSVYQISSLELQQSYLAMVREEDPDLLEQKLGELEIANNKKLAEVERIELAAKTASEKDGSDFDDFFDAIAANMSAHKAQSMKLKEMIEFNKGFDAAEITAEQGAQNIKYIEEITSLELEIRRSAEALDKKTF
jgi:hypothetical protein